MVTHTEVDNLLRSVYSDAIANWANSRNALYEQYFRNMMYLSGRQFLNVPWDQPEVPWWMEVDSEF